MEEKKYNDQVIGIFPTPVYSRYIDNFELSDNEIKSIKEKSFYRSNEGNHTFSSEENGVSTILEFENLKVLKEEIDISINRFIKDFLCWGDESNVRINSSWINEITNENEFHHQHNHSNSLISGVFYIRTLQDDKLYFDKNIKTENFNVNFSVPLKEYNGFNSNNWWVPVRDNYLYIFPSSLYHYVPPNKENDYEKYKRISISFNTFFHNTEFPYNSTTYFKV